MTLDQAIKKLETIDIRKQFGNAFMKYMAIMINTNLLAHMKRRVQETGVNANGGRFKPYSTKPALLGFSEQEPFKKAYKKLYPKKKGKQGKTFRMGSDTQWVTVNKHHLFVVPGGYKAIRNAAGYNIAFKDFTITGNMFRKVQVKDIKIEGTKIFITYGGTDELTENKLEGHDKREGINIILPSKQEIAELENNIEAWLNNWIKTALNGK